MVQPPCIGLHSYIPMSYFTSLLINRSCSLVIVLYVSLIQYTPQLGSHFYIRVKTHTIITYACINLPPCPLLTPPPLPTHTLTPVVTIKEFLILRTTT